MKQITSFSNAYAFLSNFYFCPVEIDGLVFRSAEAAFQAQKTSDETEKKFFTGYSPALAKQRGRKLPLRSDWEQIKLDVMYRVVSAKFTQNTQLAECLLQTGDAELIEENSWGDTYWGRCNGQGENHLGIILMKVRDELRAQRYFSSSDVSLSQALKSKSYIPSSDSIRIQTANDTAQKIYNYINRSFEKAEPGSEVEHVLAIIMGWILSKYQVIDTPTFESKSRKKKE